MPEASVTAKEVNVVVGELDRIAAQFKGLINTDGTRKDRFPEISYLGRTALEEQQARVEAGMPVQELLNKTVILIGYDSQAVGDPEIYVALVNGPEVTQYHLQREQITSSKHRIVFKEEAVQGYREIKANFDVSHAQPGRQHTSPLPYRITGQQIDGREAVKVGKDGSPMVFEVGRHTSEERSRIVYNFGPGNNSSLDFTQENVPDRGDNVNLLSEDGKNLGPLMLFSPEGLDKIKLAAVYTY